MSISRLTTWATTAGVAIASLSLGAAVNATTAPGRAVGLIAAAVGLAAAAFARFAERDAEASRFWKPRLSEEEAAVRRILSSLESTREPLAPEHIKLTLAVSSDTPGASSSRQMSAVAFVAEWSRRSRDTLIVGSRGAGKSTVLIELGRAISKSWLEADLDRRGTLRVPLFLDLRSWPSAPATHGSFERSVAVTISSQIGLEPRLVSHWLRRERSVLLVDGFEHLAVADRDIFLKDFYHWRFARSAPAFVACDQQLFGDLEERLRFDTVASLLPLSTDRVTAIVTSLSAAHSKRFTASLVHLADARGASPLFASLAIDALERDPGTTPRASASEIHQGDARVHHGDFPGAVASYRRAISLATDERERAAASFKLSLVLQMGGDESAALDELERSLSYKWAEETRAPSIDERLSADEEAVLSALEHGFSLDGAQLSARADLPISRTRAALRSLQDRGFVEVVGESGPGWNRYRLFDRHLSLEREG